MQKKKKQVTIFPHLFRLIEFRSTHDELKRQISRVFFFRVFNLEGRARTQIYKRLRVCSRHWLCENVAEHDDHRGPDEAFNQNKLGDLYIRN